MKALENLERLRQAAAPGSQLAAGLSAARRREPSEAQLRTLQASLAATLGAAAAGTVVGAAVRVATPALASAPVLAPALLSTGALKLTVAVVAFAATTGSVAVYRRAHVANRATVAVVASPPSQAGSAPLAFPAPREEAAAPPAATLFAGDEGLAKAPYVRSHAADGDGQRAPGAPVSTRSAPDALALIARAQRMVASDPAAALALIEENRRALARSAFTQEGEVITVAALVRLGRTDEARDRAQRFVARFPASVHTSRMRRVAEH